MCVCVCIYIYIYIYIYIHTYIHTYNAFAPQIQKVLKKYGVLLIADEVVCGFGRIGHDVGSEGACMSARACACACVHVHAYLIMRCM
jgi:hypothetical protein